MPCRRWRCGEAGEGSLIDGDGTVNAPGDLWPPMKARGPTPSMALPTAPDPQEHDRVSVHEQVVTQPSEAGLVVLGWTPSPISSSMRWVPRCGRRWQPPAAPLDARWESWAGRLAMPLEEVRRNFEAYDLLDDDVRFLPGWFADSLPSAPIRESSAQGLAGSKPPTARRAAVRNVVVEASVGQSSGRPALSMWSFSPPRRPGPGLGARPPAGPHDGGEG
jgi:hypothetical protein